MGAVRVAVNGSGEEVARFLDDTPVADRDGWDSVEVALAAWGMKEV